jgi:hypothetical protein
VRRPRPSPKRPRIGLLGRAASWLVAFVLLLQCAVGAGAALGMRIGDGAPGRMAQEHCAQHGPSGRPHEGSGQAGHDHEHCLLCNTVASDCPTPDLPLLSAAPRELLAPAAAPTIGAPRKVAYANAPRGPPPPA